MVGQGVGITRGGGIVWTERYVDRWTELRCNGEHKDMKMGDSM